MPGALRSILRRLALIALGLLLALVAAEAVLQIGALYVRLTGRAAPQGFETGRRRLVCVGDSNTYGLYLKRLESYPAQLQRQWNAEPDLPPIEVLNLGVPGTNSSKLRTGFARIVATFAPEAVLIMIGANDGWTVPVPIPPDADGAPAAEPAPPPSTLWDYSRLYRLAYMLGRWLERRPPPRLQVEFTPPGTGDAKGLVRYGDAEIDLAFTERAQGGVPDWTNALAANLRAMIATARAAGVRPVLLTYPSTYMLNGDANTVIRVVARDSGVPLIDLAAVLAEACRPEVCGGLYLPDFHLTAQGNAIAARAVREALVALLAEPARPAHSDGA